MQGRRLVLLAAIFGFLGVALGAFGAHGLRGTLEANGWLETYKTGIDYMLIHALAILAAAQLGERGAEQWTRRAGYSFAIGIVLFSGSLLTLAVFDLGFMGAVAPLGGLALLGGWAALGLAAWRGNR